MAQNLSILDGNASLAILRGAIEVSTTSTVMYGENGVVMPNPLTVKKPSLLSRLIKR